MSAVVATAPATVRFTKIGDDGRSLSADATEWVANADSRIGLMWAREAIAVKNWKPAATKKIEAQLAETKIGGFADWRIPTVEELFVLADRTRRDPAIDPDFFPDCPSDWFWCSTPYAPSPGDCAWLVDFNYGDAYYGDRDNYGFVRAVRGGQ